MARGYRSRRYRPTRRMARRYLKKKSSMARIKKDIMKCNFPTKVKFMGLPEKKVMFFTQTSNINLNNSSYAISLEPLNCPNISSIMTHVLIPGVAGTQAKLTNWDKFCILGIYIKMQPVKNQWTGAAATKDQAADTINEVRCTYTFNNCPIGSAAAYDNANINNKQIFTFNSNEAFTIYIPAPPTMQRMESMQLNVQQGAGAVTIPQISDCVIHKSKTWWSLADLKAAAFGNFQGGRGEEDEEEEEEDEADIGTPFGNTFSPLVHAGRLFFSCTGVAQYNVTINYKVALKG